MKNKKNILAVIVLIAGILSLAAFFAVRNDNQFSRFAGFISIPRVLEYHSIVFLVNSAAFIIAGIIGIFTKNYVAKSVMYCVATISAVVSCIVSDRLIISIPLLCIALLAFIIQLIDRSHEKSLRFTYHKGDILAKFDSGNPTYYDIKSERTGVPASEYEKADKTNAKTKKKHRSISSYLLNRSGEYTGYAISPKGKNYKRKNKRKNKKRR